MVRGGACFRPLRVGIVLRALRHGGQLDQDPQQAPVLQLAAQLRRQRVGVQLLAVQLDEEALAQRRRQAAPIRDAAGCSSGSGCYQRGSADTSRASGELSGSHMLVALGFELNTLPASQSAHPEAYA